MRIFRRLKSLLFLIAVLEASSGPLLVCQQGPDSQAPNSPTPIRAESIDSTHRIWQIGGFGMGGFPPYYSVHNPVLHYQEVLRFYGAAFEVGRMLTGLHGPGLLRGRGEAVGEVIPYWQVNHPAQTVTIYLAGSSTPSYLAGVGGYNVHGVSITPFAFRWNLMKNPTSRMVPWVQPAFGILWTDNIFPQGYDGILTSRFNFTPQVDFGEDFFVRKKRSLNLGVRAIHYTNFGLSWYDPGVSVVVEFTAGYSWWK